MDYQEAKQVFAKYLKSECPDCHKPPDELCDTA
jgi:TolA-binding protein